MWSDQITTRIFEVLELIFPPDFLEKKNWRERIPWTPYQNRFGYCFFMFFFQSRTRLAFSHQTDNNTVKISAIPIFHARDASGRTPLE